jgi:hypothetical protein
MSEAGANRCARCGSAVPEGRFAACPRCLLDADEPPAVIGQGTLELGAELGQGGMGTVFKARHKKLGRGCPDLALRHQ